MKKATTRWWYHSKDSPEKVRSQEELEEDELRDSQVRATAAERAATRQRAFEQTAHGKAAYKSVIEAKKPICNKNIYDTYIYFRD
jgi:hypothetical protein